MIVTKFICDRCGGEVFDQPYALISTRMDKETLKPVSADIDLFFCKDCFCEITASVQGCIDEYQTESNPVPEDPTEEPKTPVITVEAQKPKEIKLDSNPIPMSEATEAPKEVSPSMNRKEISDENKKTKKGQIIALHNQGVKPADIAEQIGVSVNTVYVYISEYKKFKEKPYTIIAR